MRYSNFLIILSMKRLANAVLQLGAPDPGKTRLRSVPSLNSRELLMYPMANCQPHRHGRKK